MYKTIILCIIFIIALTFSNCKFFESNDEQVKQNTSDIKELKTTVSNKADKNDIKALEANNSECNKRHLRSEERLTSLEQLKNAKISPVASNVKSKTKKTCNKSIKNAKKAVDINDIVAGYGENDFDPIPQADVDEIGQPKTVIPENKTISPEKKNVESDNVPMNLIDFMKKQEQLVKNGLDTVQKRCESTEKLVDQHNTALETYKDKIEKHDIQLNNHQLAIDEHRKTLETYNNELKRQKDIWNTTESRLRVLEKDTETLKHNSNVVFDTLEVLKKDVTDLKTEDNTEENEENKETEE